jgi:hypothetical protein
MSLAHAKHILGPIVCHYSRRRRTWTLHQRAATVLEIVAEAERWQRVRAA